VRRALFSQKIEPNGLHGLLGIADVGARDVRERQHRQADLADALGERAAMDCSEASPPQAAAM
jgi:hypothetical protein